MSWQFVKSAAKAEIELVGLGLIRSENDVATFGTSPMQVRWVGFVRSPEGDRGGASIPSGHDFKASDHLLLVRPIMQAVRCSNHRTPGDEHRIGDIGDEQTDPKKQPQFEFSHLRAPWLGYGAYAHLKAAVKLHCSSAFSVRPTRSVYARR